MTPITFTAAALALAATVGLASTVAAEAPGIPISATYNTATQRYCVHSTTIREANAIGSGLYQTRCMTAREWRLRGVSFTPDKRIAAR